jgi:hypothetical protein
MTESLPEEWPECPHWPIRPVRFGGGADLLNEVREWLSRHIVTLRDGDLDVLALWAVHTHLAQECYTTPRLLLDSTTPGAGKTTVLDHFERLCAGACLMGQVTSPAMLARLIDAATRRGEGVTFLIDEVDRNLSPERPGSSDLLSILNSGYRRGATRPVTVPSGDGGWEVAKMPTFAPAVFAGNSPRLPDDTRSRAITVLMVPALEGDDIEPSDWEDIEDEAQSIAQAIADWAALVRGCVSEVKAPEWLRNRDRERWLPLLRVAAVAGGDWSQRAAELAWSDLQRARMDREDEVRTKAPAEQLLHDIAEVWPRGEVFLPTKRLLAKLAEKHSSRWGVGNERGGSLTPQRLGRMLAGKHDIRAEKGYGAGERVRGYYLSSFGRAWRRWGVKAPHLEPAEPATGVEATRSPSGEASTCSDCGQSLDRSSILNRLTTCNACAMDDSLAGERR